MVWEWRSCAGRDLLSLHSFAEAEGSPANSPMHPRSLIQVARIKQVAIYVHWSVFVISAIILIESVERPVRTLVAVASYLAILVIHESGHLIVARRQGCEPIAMEIFPLHGLAVSHSSGWQWDEAVITWGGVTAQAVVGLPLTLWISIFGLTPFDAVNAFLAILGPFNLFIAAINLLPIGKLDGAKAWKLLPVILERKGFRKRARPRPAYRSPR
jgi:Zn-dependent protease